MLDAPVTRGATTERDLVITRRLPVPPATVFAAWTGPEGVRQWWGPYGMTTPVCEIDLRPGGIFRTVMRDPSGKEYPHEGSYGEIVAPHRLVLLTPEDAGGPLAGAVATITFEEEDGGTRLTAHWRHASAEGREAHERMGFVRGWGQMLDRLTAHVLRPPADSPCPAQVAPQPEHGWLHRMLGTWRYESECSMGPGQPAMRATGVERVRSLGGFWVIGEGEGGMPGGGTARMVTTFGWDGAARRFRGTWAGSMMPHMFLYEGTLDEETRVLTLDTEGPSFDGKGMARYRDVVEMQGDDHRIVTSSVLGEDGAWTCFMTAHFRREG